MISKEDILDVAKPLGVTLTNTEIEWVRLCYDDSQRQDPTANWSLVVEDLIYQCESFRKPVPDDNE